MAVDEDYYIPVRGGDSGTRIDSLAGGQNTSAIEDVEYIQKKLFAALKIPKAYLGYDEDVGAKATLAQEDIRFSRTIQRIQKTIISELNKLAMIHLYAHGFEGEDLLDFSLALSNPSSLAQQQKLELIRTKFDIAGAAPEGMVSRSWIYRNIFSFTRDEIERIQKEKIEDKIADKDLENAGSDDEGGGDEGGDSGGDAGGLFAGDFKDGNILDGNQNINIHPGLRELDEDDSLEEFDPDNLDEIDLEKITSDSGSLKPSSAAKNVFGSPLNKKRDRTVRDGPASTGMPDLKKMVLTGKSGRAQDTLNKPYDQDFLNNPFGNTFLESNQPKSLADYILGLESKDEPEYRGYRPVMTRELNQMLERLGRNLGRRSIIKEETLEFLNEEFDFELDED